jgi:catechol 2,3-dioxygenase-like lactoylglutathione lyase family enzyme
MQYNCINAVELQLKIGAGMSEVPRLDGIHHLKLPVADLQRSLAWYQDRLGYVVMQEFVEDGVLMGIAMTHPNGGPDLAIRLDPERARAAAGFDYFAIGVPGLEAIEALAARLSQRDDRHAGVHRTPVGWVLPGVHDPDGHEVRFYTVPLELPPDLDAVGRADHRIGRP